MVMSMWLTAMFCSKEVSASILGQQYEASPNLASATPMAEAKLPDPPQVQSEFDNVKPAAGDLCKKPLAPGQSAGWRRFVDSSHGFSLCLPNGFVTQPKDVSRLSQFTPSPVASIFFMNPTVARGDQSGIEPPDLEVRVYQVVGVVDSLKRWLGTAGFLDSGSFAQPYGNNGQKICKSTMIFPNCFIYFLNKARVYQLTPFTQAGESIIETFLLLP